MLEIISRKDFTSIELPRPERMVVAGVGVDHDTLVEAAQRHFVEQRPVWETEGGVADVQTDRSIAQYTGGIVSREKDLSDVSLGPTPMPELGHIVIGLLIVFLCEPHQTCFRS